jgi:hypothetical protein
MDARETVEFNMEQYRKVRIARVEAIICLSIAILVIALRLMGRL